MQTRLKIAEEVASDGTVVALSLVHAGAHIELRRGEARVGAVSARVVSEVVLRYGRPLEDQPEGMSEAFALGEGESLRSWRYRAPVDLEAKLYLLLYRDGHEPLAVLGRQAANALCFLCGERS